MPAKPCQHNTGNNFLFFYANIALIWMHNSVLVKLKQLFMWLCTLLESFLIDLVCFTAVALILVFLSPGYVEGCLSHSYSLDLHVPVNFQGFCTVFGLKTQHTNKWNQENVYHVICDVRGAKLRYQTYKFYPEFNVAKVVVIFLNICEFRHCLFQQCDKVALFTTLRKCLLCPLYIAVNSKNI